MPPFKRSGFFHKFLASMGSSTKGPAYWCCHMDLVRACSVYGRYLFTWWWPLYLFSHLALSELGVTDSQYHVSLRLTI